MEDSDLFRLWGFIKNAEMELSEAAFKAGDGDFKTARQCLDVALRSVGEAKLLLDP